MSKTSDESIREAVVFRPLWGEIPADSDLRTTIYESVQIVDSLTEEDFLQHAFCFLEKHSSNLLPMHGLK